MMKHITWPTKDWLMKHNKSEVDAKMTMKINKVLNELEQEHVFCKTSRSYCHVHKRECLTEPLDDDFLIGETGQDPNIASKGIRCAVAGMTCVHWSPAGDMLGFAGDSAKPCLVWLEERRRRKEPFFIIECVFAAELIVMIKEILSDLYDIDHTEVNPFNLGHPVARNRLYVTGLLHSILKRTQPMSGLTMCFGRQTISNPYIYLVLPDEYMEKIIKAQAKARHKVIPPDSKLCYNDTLAEAEKCTLEEYLSIRDQMVEEHVLMAEDPFICDLRHNPHKQAKISTEKLSTLTRNQLRYSFHHQRGMCGQELLAAQGIATEAVLQHALKQSPTGSKKQPLMAKAALSGATEGALNSMTGNGMHLHAIGAVITWMFAHACLKQPSGGGNPEPVATDAPSGRNFAIGCHLHST